MKTNSIIKIDEVRTVRREKGRNGRGASVMMTVANEMESFWELYEAQMKRNGELMKIIDKQQQFIQKVMSKGALVNFSSIVEMPAELAEAPMPEFKDMSVEELFKCTAYFKKLFGREVKRLDGVQGSIKILYSIKQLGGSAGVEQLFDVSKIGKSTGFRHVVFLKKRLLIKPTGGRYDKQYTITKWGKELLAGRLKKDYDKPTSFYATQEEGEKAWEHYFELK